MTTWNGDRRAVRLSRITSEGASQGLLEPFEITMHGETPIRSTFCSRNPVMHKASYRAPSLGPWAGVDGWARRRSTLSRIGTYIRTVLYLGKILWLI